VKPPLAEIVRGFGVEPDAIRFIRRRYNTHWRVRAGGGRYVLRRFGTWKGAEDDPAWENAWVTQMAEAGLPVPAPIGGSRVVGGAVHILMPYLPGRPMRAWGAGHVSDAHYRALGRHLADFHTAIAHLPLPPQRPRWGETVAGALPLEGGRERRAELLAALTEADARLGARFAEAAERLEARNLPAVFAGAPRIVVQADFSPWNVRVRGGRMVGLIDFELAHVDVRAADVAAARRGWHDAVVDGYRERAALSDAELAALDGLWLGGILAGIWRVLADRIALGEPGGDLIHGFDWDDAQLDKTRPYRG
jgi:Ser/Thr protein kinase RdoA (MazF antagonist)